MLRAFINKPKSFHLFGRNCDKINNVAESSRLNSFEVVYGKPEVRLFYHLLNLIRIDHLL